MSDPEDTAANEQQPLLQDPAEADHGTIQRQSDGTPLAEEPTTARLTVVLGTVWVGVFLAALDQTIVANLTGPISADFNSFRLLSWLATAYIIANAALQPLSGRLTDIFSRRTGLLFSNIFFAAGNLICGLAKREWVILFGRVVAGIGGGGLNAISTFVASDLVPLRRRGLWQGLGNICFGTGSGLGGVFGGLMHDSLGWRWAFLIQVPLVVFSGILVFFFTTGIPVKESNKSKLSRVDFLGAFTLVVFLVLLLLGLNSGGNIVPWNHPLVTVSLPLSFVALLVFIYVEDRIASEPIIPVRLLLNRTVMAACLVNSLMSMSVFAIIIFGPIYFQALGLSATQAGLRMVPLSVGTAIGSLCSGIFMRMTGRYYYFCFAVNAISVLGTGLILGTFNRHLDLVPSLIFLFLVGLSYGGMLTCTLLALISAVDHKHQAVVTSASYAFRSTGSTIGITCGSAVFQNLLRKQLWDRLGDREGAAEIIERVRDSINEVRKVPEGWQDAVLDSYVEALRGVWGLALGLSVAGMLIGLLMREHTLHKNLARTTSNGE